ncbi:hypothetical protein D9757_014350 [Collybiopsis confluens]|uniref:Uncharacterized protein n=1 Tax=Collybiopsis confluens TaxID=2823264 RepID=A0A8H5CVA6_9AGAR|nr:hypothetical protein D9757_014350 [Collybiopsis confluens]
MKKSVIKRRKRVPAASGTGAPIPMRMSDQAAAEALVSVGRAGAGGSGPGEESDDLDALEGDQPKKKRSRKSKDDGAFDGSPEQHHQWIGEGGSHLHAHRPGSIPPMHFIHPSLQRPGAPPFPHAGGMLPGINSMDISSDPSKVPHGVMFIPGGPGVPGTAGPPPGYVRSGSAAPSRSHSPPNSQHHPPPPPGTFILPSPHGPGGILHPLEVPGSGHGHVMVSMVAPGVYSLIPTLSDLERHYTELEDQKKRMEEILDRTERMMQGLKRGIDDMRTGSVPPPGVIGSRPPSTAPGAATSAAPSVPIQRPPSSSGSEKERRESVWAVVDPAIRGSD